MTTLDIILIAILALVFVLLILVIISKKNTKNSNTTNNNDELMNKLNQIINSTSNFQEIKNDIYKNIGGNEEIMKSFKGIIGEVHKQQIEIKSDIKNLDKSSDIANICNHVSSIHNMFTKAKTRGAAGETICEDILYEYLGSVGFEKQASVNGGIIDFIVKTKNKIIGIDSKFPADNWNKFKDNESEENKKKFINDVKTMIKDLNKYITKNDIKQILMFIPSEQIFHGIIELIGFNELTKLQKESKVFLCSPTYFILYIALIKDLQDDEKMSADIENQKKNINNFKDLLITFFERWNKHGDYLKNTYISYVDVSNTSNKIHKSYNEILPNNQLDSQIKETNNNQKDEVKKLSEDLQEKKDND